MTDERLISIHAPRTGSDTLFITRAFGTFRFQSTLPARGATVPAAVILADIRLFQSTLPARGATDPRAQSFPRKYTFQSTLPARGATRRRGTGTRRICDFNPRSPHGERRAATELPA